MPGVLVGHAFRVYLFAALIGRRRSLDFSDELLFVAAAFHHLGLTGRFSGSSRRFELDSADAAIDFLSPYRLSDTQAQGVWNAIALHTTFGLGGFESPLVELLQAGVGTDLMALHFDEIAAGDRAAVVRAYPREPAFKSLIINALADGIAWRPASTFGNVTADILERRDPDFCRVNFCGLILGCRWEQ
ncbi:phosphohydrolase [Pararobbsia alpina]|uniref:phosphohydrolase n=1 Tax=Pararobbsia alpina TaxID=621374 RepID=UPI0039A6A5B9